MDEELGEDEEPASDDEDELTHVISAETQEWDGLEEAERQGEAEKTFVRSAAGAVAGAGSKARSAITSGFEAVRGEKVTSGFKAVAGRLRFPLWARFLTAAFVIVALGRDRDRGQPAALHRGDRRRSQAGPRSSRASSRTSRWSTVASPQTILILGSDKRPEFKKDKFRGLSDTTMLLRVDPDRNAIALFSLPRDLKVEIPGYRHGQAERGLRLRRARADPGDDPGADQGPRRPTTRASRSTTSSTSTSRASPGR